MPSARAIGLSDELKGLRLKIRTNLSHGKMYADSEEEKFSTKKDASLKLPVRKRYSSALVVEFRSSNKLLDKSPAFCVLWLKDIPDEEETTVTLPVWKGNMKRAQVNTVPTDSEEFSVSGEIELRLKFWCGLSGFHSKLASKDTNLADVMEVLDTSYDNDDDEDDTPDSKETRDDTSSSSDSDDDLSHSGERGTIGQIKDYKTHAKQLHRRNRGLMQWKAPRTMNWVVNKAEHAEGRLTSLFKHHDRDVGIETEA